MTAIQRTATLEMCAAILRCSCTPPDIRFRAGNLQACLITDGLLRRLRDRFGQ